MATAATAFGEYAMATANRAELLRDFAGAGQEPGQIVELLQLWQERQRYRSELRRLMRTGGHLLTDIGILPAQAEREARKNFWQA